VTGKVAATNTAANGQKCDQDSHAHTSDKAATGNVETNAENAHTSDNASQDNAHATSAAPRAEAPCPAAAFADMEAADSSIAAAAHVANNDAAAADSVPHNAHAPDNVAHPPDPPAVPHVANKDAAAAAAVPQPAHAPDNVAHAPDPPAVPHVANKDAAAFLHGSLQAFLHAADIDSTSATPRHPPAGDDEFDESYFFPRPYTSPSALNVEYHENTIKKHKNKESDESCQNKKKKEKKKKKKGKKPKDILILPALVPDENESDDVMR